VIGNLLTVRQALLISPRNSESASSHLLDVTGCSKFVYSPERSKQIEELKGANPSLQAWLAPGLWEVLDSSASAPVVEEPTEDPEDRIAVYIHSSGTTGECISLSRFLPELRSELL
jgi:hypothetical protein